MTSLNSPNLDDRSFDELVAEAIRQVRQSCPEWNDLSPGDPGVVLLEVFAHMTETLIQRLNRLPDKAYIEFLRLIGVKLQPPAAATTTLKFSLTRPQTYPVEIRRGIRVTSKRLDKGIEPPVFSVARTVTIPAGATETEVLAHHCDLVEAELAGHGTGLPGQWVNVSQPPLISPSGDNRDLLVAVEVLEGQIDAPDNAIKYQDKTFGIWREVDDFSQSKATDFVYTVDRAIGQIQFAPALSALSDRGGIEDRPMTLASMPPADAEIRVWYRRGGGRSGNVQAQTLTVLKDNIPGVSVTNPEPAIGGCSAESMENALLRGPQQLHSLRRAVTARDFELLAVASSGAVSRAKAFTKAALWHYAPPGTVGILLVPELALKTGQEHLADHEYLLQLESDAVLKQIRDALNLRRPLGIECEVDWVRYKPIHVKAKVIVNPEEDVNEVKQRVLGALYRTICPQSKDPAVDHWPFGQALKSWDIYKIIGAEPGVLSVEQLRLIVEDVPDKDVVSLAADQFQEQTWYVGSGSTLFRSLDDAKGWEKLTDFADEKVTLIKSYPNFPGCNSNHMGLVAVATLAAGNEALMHLYFSKDCGETWQSGPALQFEIYDMAWLERDSGPVLLIAAETGLYQLRMGADSVPEQILVDAHNPKLGFDTLAVSLESNQGSIVSVSAPHKGVFVSYQAGESNTFKAIGLTKELIKVLAIQRRGPHTYLWAGVAPIGDEHGHGCFCWRITASGDNPEGWRQFGLGWEAGTCIALAFKKSRVFAASRNRGVLSLDIDLDNPSWTAPDVNCGLPLRDLPRLQPVLQVATSLHGDTLIAAGEKGVYKSGDTGVTFQHCSMYEFSEQLTLPKNWLFCSGTHEIEVISSHETE
ncbi:MAG: putative baseplate assembly protein [Gammaproteobacteria bacterium]